MYLKVFNKSGIILECCPAPDVVFAIVRIVVVAVARWIVSALVVVIAPAIPPVVGAVGLSIYPCLPSDCSSFGKYFLSLLLYIL